MSREARSSGDDADSRASSSRRLAGVRVAVATHVYATGPAHALADYLASEADELLFIGHPFSYAPERRSVLRRVRDGVVVDESWRPRRNRLPDPVWWIEDFFLTIVWVLRARGQIDLLVAADSLLAAAALVLRRLGKVRLVVFWTIDYVPDRFSNRVLNWIYHRFDRVCVRHCDEVWNLSPRMAAAREAQGLIRPQRLVPMGSTPRHARVRKPPARKRHQIVFLGHLLEKQGVQVVLEALPEVLRVFPDATFLVIGDGPYRETLELRTSELGLQAAVRFVGFVQDHREVERLLESSGVGVATYDPDSAGFSLYGDPGKIKTYLAASLAVITTPVTHIAAEVEARGCGRVVAYSPSAVAAAIQELIADPHRHELYCARAREMAASFEWPAIFDRAFAQFVYP
jgi:glycosyltransferase involved in cell wall biosynthesis